MNKRYDRLNEIVSILKEKNGATVKELAGYFKVSEMTIRRDLGVLEDKNIVNNVYGAAIFNPDGPLTGGDKDYSLDFAHITMEQEKIRIGKRAAAMITDEDVVIIDTGSTTEKLAFSVSGDCKASFYCYNLNIMNYLAGKKNIRLACAGGYYHPNTQMLESQEGIAFLRAMRATKAFVSAAGIHESLGVTCATNYEAPTKQAVIESSVEKILLADSSKFDQVKSAYFADIGTFQTVVTDKGLSERWREILRAAGIELVLV